MPAAPEKGRSAALKPTTPAGLMLPSSVIRSATAAPAECPATSTGLTASTCSRERRAPAMPGSDMRLLAGVSVSP